METPSSGDPPSRITALSVQVVEAGRLPDPDTPQRDGSRLAPLTALLVLIAFGGGYLLARSPGRSVLPETMEETTISTTTTVRSTTSSDPSDQTVILESEPSGWFAIPPSGFDDGVTLAAREGGPGVNDVAVDAEGYVWALGSGVATRWNPADATSVTFGEDVFGYAVPDRAAAGPDGVVWIIAGPEVFRFDGTWARFRIPDPDEHPIELGVTPSGELIVVVVREDDYSVRLYRTGPDVNPATSEVLDLPVADVNDMAVGPWGEVWLTGGGEDARQVVSLEGNRLTPLPRLVANEVQDVGEIAATFRVWVTDGERRVLYGLEDGEWVGVDLPDTGRTPWGDRYPWTMGAGDSIWAAATTPDGVGLQLVRVDEPGSYVTYPPFDGASGFVSSIEVADGRVWLGTETGLCSFDPTTGSWRLWSTPPPEGSVPASIDAVAVGPDGTLRVVLNTDPPRIGSLDGSTWEPAGDGLIPTECEEFGSCNVEMVGSSVGDVWVLVNTPIGNTLWHNVSGQTWDPVAVPDELPSLGFSVDAFGAGAGGTLWATNPPWTAYFDGTDWTVWSQEDGPEPWALVVGGDGTPWGLEVGWASGRLWVFVEGRWKPAEPPLPDVMWPVVAADAGGTVWIGADRRVWSFDGSTWTLQVEADGWVTAFAPASGSRIWVAAGDLWLIGDGPPVLVARGLDAWSLAADPDGSVWALGERGLYHVAYPAEELG